MKKTIALLIALMLTAACLPLSLAEEAAAPQSHICDQSNFDTKEYEQAL